MEEVKLTPKAARDVLKVLKRHGIDGYLASIIVSKTPEIDESQLPNDSERLLILYFYEKDGVCQQFTSPQQLPGCRI
jgi:hypothetical protein